MKIVHYSFWIFDQDVKDRFQGAFPFIIQSPLLASVAEGLLDKIKTQESVCDYTLDIASVNGYWYSEIEICLSI